MNLDDDWGKQITEDDADSSKSAPDRPPFLQSVTARGQSIARRIGHKTARIMNWVLRLLSRGPTNWR